MVEERVPVCHDPQEAFDIALAKLNQELCGKTTGYEKRKSLNCVSNAHLSASLCIALPVVQNSPFLTSSCPCGTGCHYRGPVARLQGIIKLKYAVMKGIICHTDMLRMRSRVTETVLVVFGALLGAMVGLFVKSPLPIKYLGFFLPIALALLFFGVGGHLWLQHKWYIKTRGGLALSSHPCVSFITFLLGNWITALTLRSFISKRSGRFPLKVPKIGILEDLGWDAKNTGQIATYTKISPKKWQSLIKYRARKHELPVEVELIKASQNLDPYIMVLNPYGGVYPEYDLETDATFTKVLRYVKAGGVFINVADVPGFWAYPLEETKRRRHVGNIEPVRSEDVSFPTEFHTPLLDRLGVPMYGGESIEWKTEFKEPFSAELEGKLTVKANLAAQTKWETGTGPETIVTPVEKLKKVGNSEFNGCETTPMFMVDYGRGKFVISTPPLCFPNGSEAIRFLCETIADLVLTTAEKLAAVP
jgi:hypothetical protein